MKQCILNAGSSVQFYGMIKLHAVNSGQWRHSEEPPLNWLLWSNYDIYRLVTSLGGAPTEWVTVLNGFPLDQKIYITYKAMTYK